MDGLVTSGPSDNSRYELMLGGFICLRLEDRARNKGSMNKLLGAGYDVGEAFSAFP